MSQPQSSNAMRYGSSYPSASPAVASRACPACGSTPPSTRSVYCTPACKQLAYRLRRRTLHSTVDPVFLRKELQRRRVLVAHTVYECSRCGERLLGERRCGDRHLYARSIGLGGSCPDCDTVILLADLLGPEVMTTA
jgi:DNA-directed RNA polymerase subunit RPC12/RpoP